MHYHNEPQFLPATAVEKNVDKSRNEEDSTPGKACGRFTSVSKEFGGASFASKRTDPGNGTRKFNNQQGTPTSQTMKRGL